MTKIVKFFCDVCRVECIPQKGLATFAGFLIKMNEKLETENVNFEGNYCPECSEKILTFISEIKNAANRSAN